MERVRPLCRCTVRALLRVLLLCAYIVIFALVRIVVSRDIVWRVIVVVRSLGSCYFGLKERGVCADLCELGLTLQQDSHL